MDVPEDTNLMEEPMCESTEETPSLESQALMDELTSTTTTKEASRCLALSDMPEEILEHILGFLSPYTEMEMAKLVSKQWNRVIKSAVKQKKRRFYQSLSKCEVQWTEIHKEKPPSFSEKGHIGITDRFSHSAAYHNGFMYVFGGCTSTSTTFNDLWSFDLTHRRWVRPVAMGTYPSPKACATMVVYDGNLVLYGGWSHPIPYPLHQSAHYFSELHMYTPSINRWTSVHSLGQEPEALGGHSASVVGHLMVVFGGSPRPGMGTNNLWVFNFQKTSWTLQPVACDAVPEPRYGQFQTTLDDRHILIMGGCVGQNRIYTDVWLLTLEPSSPWRWTKLTVECPELGAPQTWCHAACKVNNFVVVVAKSNTQRQTKLVKRTRRSRHDRGRQAAAPFPSTSSSPSLPFPAEANKPDRLRAFEIAGSSKMQGVYVHPKLQPQPKRDIGMTNSKSKGTNSELVGESRASATTGEGRRPSTEASTLRCETESPSAYAIKSSMQPPSTTLSSSKPHSGQPSGSSLSLAQGWTTPSGTLQQGQSQSTSSALHSNNLLSLQQRLHRECLNLPDPDNHHHNPRRRCGGGGGGGGLGVWRSEDDDDDGVGGAGAMPEGYFHRLHNRWLEGQVSGDAVGVREARGPLQPSSPQLGSLPSISMAAPGQSESDRLLEKAHGSSYVNNHPSGNGSHNESTGCPADSKQNVGETSALTSGHEAFVPPEQFPHGQHQQPSSSRFAGFQQVQGSLPPRHAMPSIRPNATSNRQRQLEALQRQEELLRSKSRALAAARAPKVHVHPLPSHQKQNQQTAHQQYNPPAQQQQNMKNIPAVPAAEGQEALKEAECDAKRRGNMKHDKDNGNNIDDNDDVDDNEDIGAPSSATLIPSKNKMDVHVLDISRAQSDHVVRWGPLSELQPPGAPEETICCSLVGGRGELALFGGVRRDLTGAELGPAGVSNMAVSRLYLLEPG